MKTIEQRLSKCRTRLLLDSPWFGSLAMRLKMESAPGLGTFATDGTRILYDPLFAESLTDEEIIFVLAHEVLHNALLHPFRMGNRDREQSNIAMDLAINYELTQAGFKIIAGSLLDPQYAGMSWEAIYAQRQKQGNPQPKSNGTGKGAGTLGATGECMPGQQPGKGAKDAQAGGQPGGMTEADWKIAVQSATNVCKGAGTVPAGFESLIDSARKDVADWRAILREFVENTVPSDYSWTNPNRRHIAHGLYLPGITRENMGHIAVAVDTSGSIDCALLAAFCTELNAIANETKPERVSVLYCDSAVHRVDEYGPDEEIVMKAVGRGGTAFQPVFDAIAKWPEQPVCLIYFSDMDSSDVPTEPGFPTLWATSECTTASAPFGRLIRIAEGR
jgi:predicted metal-dependent peptidase